ncbi:MAG: RimK/LysX family protein [Porticoccaceae bacterium]
MIPSLFRLTSAKGSPRVVWIFSLMLYALCASLPVHASSKTPGKVIAGWVEKITLPASKASTKAITIKAKLDTGAETSSIHAENIKIYKRGGKRWVDFTLVIKDIDDKTHRITMKKPLELRVKIKKHDGDHDSRPIVELDICFDGRLHSTLFSLVDRSEFIYPALLGRKFIEGVALVDPQASFLTQAYCE